MINIHGIRETSKIPQILYWDIETSSIDIKYRTYDLSVKIKRFDPETIERDWTMLSVAWAFNDEPVKCIGVSPKNPLNDYEIVRQFREVLNQADYIVGHNMDAFDLKKFNTRAAFYGLDPIGQKQSIDTLKIARKYFKFTSNTLRYIAKFYNVHEKDNSPDWNACLEGDADALAYMRQYNKQDVEVTRQVYYKMRAWHHMHPNLNVKNPVKDAAGNKVEGICPSCLSPNTIKDGHAYTKETKRKKWICRDCGNRFTGKAERR
jgi:DNA polymerase III epsilon subunit-like protein